MTEYTLLCFLLHHNDSESQTRGHSNLRQFRKYLGYIMLSMMRLLVTVYTTPLPSGSLREEPPIHHIICSSTNRACSAVAPSLHTMPCTPSRRVLQGIVVLWSTQVLESSSTSASIAHSTIYTDNATAALASETSTVPTDCSGPA